jgi:hypothetical protein
MVDITNKGYKMTDYVNCPACGSSVAELVEGLGIDYAHCKHDCGFKWHMLIEPDPDLYDELGDKSPIVLFEDDIDDIEKDRYYRVLEWSDLGDSLEGGSERTVPENIGIKRQRFFENFGRGIHLKEDEMLTSYIQNYIDNETRFENVLYALSSCSMNIKRTSKDVVYKIEYNQFNANAFRKISPISIEEMSVLLKEKDIIFEEIEYIPEAKVDTMPTFIKLYDGIKAKSPKSFYEIAMTSEALNPLLKPSAVTLDYYKTNIKQFRDYPSMIDLDNEMVYLNISHKSFMEQLIEETDFSELERKFHAKFNMVQYAVSKISKNRLLTDSKENLSKVLDIFPETQSIILDDLILDFMVLNGSGSVEGKIYIPKEEEEINKPGKILVIPTSSEEYFLPALSTIDGVGCIITERGSKTSHLVSNSKEFNFNIILVENALKIFKAGEKVCINLDNRTIIFR